MRVFVALNLAPDTRAAIHTAAEPLRAAVGGVAWTRGPALHVTVKFLGEVPDVLPRQLASALAAGRDGIGTVGLELGGVGAFPSPERPRVLWLGVAANSALVQLYQRVESACAALGFARESRPYHPHVTLGRVRRGTHVDPAILAQAAEQVRFRGREVVGTVDIMESVLEPGGTRYRVLHAVPIGGRPGED